MSQEQVGELVSALNQCPERADRKHLVSLVAPKVTSFTREDLAAVVGVLYALSTVRSEDDAPLRKFISELLTAMNESGDPDLVVSADEAPSLQERFTELLQIDSLNLATKAADLRLDHERTFCSAKILTDLRPIFEADPAAPPVGVIVTHTLKLTYHDHDGHQEFYVALDSNGIKALRKALVRAEAKAVSLKAVLKDSGIRDFDSE